MRLKKLSISFLCFMITLLVMNAVNLAASNADYNAKPKAETVSLAKILGLSAISSFSPGIALLSVTYNVEKEKNVGGKNNWLVKWLWLFWIIAFIDVILDKFPGLANVNQFVEHGLIWYVAYVAVTALGADFTMVYGALTGSTVQAVRQGYHGAGALVAATPAISTLEDIVTGVAAYAIL